MTTNIKYKKTDIYDDKKLTVSITATKMETESIKIDNRVRQQHRSILLTILTTKNEEGRYNNKMRTVAYTNNMELITTTTGIMTEILEDWVKNFLIILNNNNIWDYKMVPIRQQGIVRSQLSLEHI